MVVGTSAGTQVGAVVASGTPWDDAWGRQVDPKRQPVEENPSGSLGSLFAKYDEIAASSRTPEEWIQRIVKLATESKTITESERLSQIRTRIGDLQWAETLRIVAVDLTTSQRVVWGAHSGIELHRAVSASCSLQGYGRQPSSVLGSISMVEPTPWRTLI